MAGRLEGIHVLIIDDDPDILAGISLALRTEGATTETAADGAAAIRAVSLRTPDLVVLDMMLPTASGFVVLEKIRALPEGPPVIMVTANQGRRHQAYAQSLGADAYFYKPVPLSKLIDRAVDLMFEEVDDDESGGAAGTADARGTSGGDAPPVDAGATAAAPKRGGRGAKDGTRRTPRKGPAPESAP